MAKTNAARMLERAGIPFLFMEYPVDENDLSGEHVAEVLGVPAEQVFKTLVLEGERREHFVCCIPANAKIDLKKAAKAAGAKKAAMIPMKDLLPVTGYVRGGCSPIGMKKSFPTFLDETAMLFDDIIVSAGMRGGMLRLAPDALAEFAAATYADLVSDA